MSDDYTIPLALASVSHHQADVATLEAFQFPDEKVFLQKAKERFKGVILLQTCNRIEVVIHGAGEALSDFLLERGRTGYITYSGVDALRHLFELASGIDSMIIGEDQIIGQMKKAFLVAEDVGALDHLTRTCFEKAIHVGIQVRRKTNINRGAVSIGSAAVALAEEVLGSLENRHILVIGSGEMGMLVTKALAVRGLTAIYVANRTYERAVALANKIGGKAVNLKDLYHYLVLSDVVISCTSAPHSIIHIDRLIGAMKERQWPLEEHPRPIIIIDIAQPRDVEEGAEKIDGVRLFTIDDLKCISENNLQSRRDEVDQAVQIIDEELGQCVRLIKRAAVDDTLATLYTWAESIRVRERDRALNRLGVKDDRTRAIVDDLTHVLVKKLLSDATYAIRSYAERGDIDRAEAIVKAITESEQV